MIFFIAGCLLVSASLELAARSHNNQECKREDENMTKSQIEYNEENAEQIPQTPAEDSPEADEPTLSPDKYSGSDTPTKDAMEARGRTLDYSTGEKADSHDPYGEDFVLKEWKYWLNSDDVSELEEKGHEGYNYPSGRLRWTAEQINHFVVPFLKDAPDCLGSEGWLKGRPGQKRGSESPLSPIDTSTFPPPHPEVRASLKADLMYVSGTLHTLKGQMDQTISILADVVGIEVDWDQINIPGAKQNNPVDGILFEMHGCCRSLFVLESMLKSLTADLGMDELQHLRYDYDGRLDRLVQLLSKGSKAPSLYIMLRATPNQIHLISQFSQWMIERMQKII